MVALLVGIVLDVAAGVVSRYVFNASFRWTEELGFVMFVWLIFFGITRAHRRRQHIAVDVVARSAPAALRPAFEFGANFIVAYTTCVMIFSAWDAATLIGGVLPALGWPTEVRYLPLCATAALGLACLLLREIESGGAVLNMVAAIAFGVAVFVATGVLDLVRIPALAPTQVMLGAFSVGVLLGAPVGYVLLFSAYLATWGADLLPAAAVAQNMINGASKFILLAIPLFLLAGYLMNAGGLTTRLYDLAFALVGHWRGGFAQVNVVNSVLVGGVSGSSSADAAMDTKMLVPQMVRHGYTASFSCAITAASAILPNIIPPSIAMLIYASIAQVSILKLFLAGYLTGLVLAGTLMVCVYVISVRRGYGHDRRWIGRSGLARAVRAAIPVLVMPLLIVGGIRFGITTATEAGGIAVVYALGLGFWLREFRPGDLLANLRDAAGDAALIGFLLAVTAPFGYVMISERLPQQVVQWVVSLTTDPLVLLLLINLVLLFAGMFLDLAVSILILVPLTVPVVTQMGVDPIHYAIIVIVNLMIGGITPPVGQLVFVTSSIARVPATEVFRASMPFLAALLVGLALITVFPGISLFLPRLLG
ncbi:MAG: TRAP transporter large permease subunit [Alphaproteobacteria bacterium]|nr:TRAP transporter large permease subunit [Alphaproteobacteria bacterium]